MQQPDFHHVSHQEYVASSPDLATWLSIVLQIFFLKLYYLWPAAQGISSPNIWLTESSIPWLEICLAATRKKAWPEITKVRVFSVAAPIVFQLMCNFFSSWCAFREDWKKWKPIYLILLALCHVLSVVNFIVYGIFKSPDSTYQK